MISSIVGFSQEAEIPELGPQGKHELRLDALDALAFTTIEINYEYVVSKYTGVGAAISFNLGDDSIDDYGRNFAFTPYYRQYFLNKKEYGARGLFVEGSIQLAAGEQSYYYSNYDPITNSYDDGTNEEKWFEAGVGLAIGQKWVSNNGFVFEISAGGGRYLLDSNHAPEAYFRGGILVGYRF